MKLSIVASVALCMASATSFTVGPQTKAVSRSLPRNPTVSLKMSEALAAQEAFAKAEIDSNDVVVFSKTYCGFSTKTKELFTELGVDFKVHELDTMGDDGPALQMALLQMTGQKSVPNVFVKGTHMGGNDDTQAAAREGKLQEMLGL